MAGSAVANDFSAGVSLHDFDDFGVLARWAFPFAIEGSSLNTGATYYFDGSYLAIDADVHFALSKREMSSFYPLVGLQLATDFDWSELGFNLGGGYQFGLDANHAAYVEAKFLIGDLDGFVATFGVGF